MTTPEAEEPGLLVVVALASALLAERWLRGRMTILTAALSLAAMVGALSVGAASCAVGAFFGPLLGPWSPLRIWLTMLTAATFDLVVMGVLGPP